MSIVGDPKAEAGAMINWPSILLTLRSMHWSTVQVSVTLRIARSTINGWLSGSEPRHCDGERLIALWSEVTQLPREALPQRSSKCRDSDMRAARYSAQP